MSNYLYRDKLVSITEDEIVFENYYFPSSKRKVVRLADIESITVSQPSIWNGKWRLHGTGNFKIWYPADYDRPKRDKIFVASLKTQWVNIGFTVEESAQVEKLFRDKNLIQRFN